MCVIVLCLCLWAALSPCLKPQWRSCTGAQKCRRALSPWAEPRGNWASPLVVGPTTESSHSSPQPPEAEPPWVTSSWRLAALLSWEWPLEMCEGFSIPARIPSALRPSPQVPWRVQRLPISVKARGIIAHNWILKALFSWYRSSMHHLSKYFHYSITQCDMHKLEQPLTSH